jgi:hypothetical protein
MCGMPASTNFARIDVLREQHEVVTHRDLGNDAAVLQRHRHLLPRLCLDAGHVIFHQIVAGDRDFYFR